jgi:hypothetical protein
MKREVTDREEIFSSHAIKDGYPGYRSCIYNSMSR